MRRSADSQRSGCPISIALEWLGDAWSLLIVRDLMFQGKRSFQEFASGEEGIASNILTDRLGRLEAGGIITRSPDPADGRRLLYRLTRKGIDLAPALVELVLWSARHHRTEAPPAIIRKMTRNREAYLAEIRARWEEGEAG